jgi:hypothetical protein
LCLEFGWMNLQFSLAFREFRLHCVFLGVTTRISHSPLSRYRATAYSSCPRGSHLSMSNRINSVSCHQFYFFYSIDPCSVPKLKLNSVAWVRERTTPTERPLLAKLVPTFSYKKCHVVSVTDIIWHSCEICSHELNKTTKFHLITDIPSQIQTVYLYNTREKPYTVITEPTNWCMRKWLC